MDPQAWIESLRVCYSWLFLLLAACHHVALGAATCRKRAVSGSPFANRLATFENPCRRRADLDCSLGVCYFLLRCALTCRITRESVGEKKGAARSVRMGYKHRAARRSFAGAARAPDRNAVGSVCKESTSSGARATRNPLLFVRFAGWFVLRFAIRQFAAPLSQPPPRITRVEPYDCGPQALVSLAIESAKWPRQRRAKTRPTIALAAEARIRKRRLGGAPTQVPSVCAGTAHGRAD